MNYSKKRKVVNHVILKIFIQEPHEPLLYNYVSRINIYHPQLFIFREEFIKPTRRCNISIIFYNTININNLLFIFRDREK